MRRLLASAMAAGLLLAACGSDGDDARGGTAPTTGAAVSATVGDGGPGAPEALRFDATTIEGAPLDLSAYAGQTVALWFWAPT